MDFMKKPQGIYRKLFTVVFIFMVIIGLLLAYLQISWRRAENTPWVIYVHKENRDNSTGRDSHIPCLEKIGAKYKFDDVGNLLVKQGQANRVDDRCS